MKPIAAWRAGALLVALGAGAGTDGALAQSVAVAAGMEAELRRCRGIADSLVRIACYDAIALPPGGAAAPAATATQAGMAPASSATTSAPRAAATSAPLREFGLPERPSSQVESIESSLPGAFDGWTPGFKLRLANGQLWEIVDGSTGAYSLRDPKVRITRGLLGSFFMSIEGAAHQPRVRRLQ